MIHCVQSAIGTPKGNEKTKSRSASAPYGCEKKVRCICRCISSFSIDRTGAGHVGEGGRAMTSSSARDHQRKLRVMAN